MLNYRGEWKGVESCEKDMAICGIKVRMADESTALNGARFQCCLLPEYYSSNSTNKILPICASTPSAITPSLPMTHTPAAHPTKGNFYFYNI